MTAIIIGISSGILLIVLFAMLKQFDKEVVFGLALAGIGFIYIGFTWSNSTLLIVSAIQALVFLILAYYGIKKNIYILAIGYFLHGGWDLAYNLFNEPGLIPPHYDVFCLSFDFAIGIYLLIFAKKYMLTQAK
jgi:hypothetical protein